MRKRPKQEGKQKKCAKNEANKGGQKRLQKMTTIEDSKMLQKTKEIQKNVKNRRQKNLTNKKATKMRLQKVTTKTIK